MHHLHHHHHHHHCWRSPDAWWGGEKKQLLDPFFFSFTDVCFKARSDQSERTWQESHDCRGWRGCFSTCKPLSEAQELPEDQRRRLHTVSDNRSIERLLISQGSIQVSIWSLKMFLKSASKLIFIHHVMRIYGVCSSVLAVEEQILCSGHKETTLSKNASKYVDNVTDAWHFC